MVLDHATLSPTGAGWNGGGARIAIDFGGARARIARCGGRTGWKDVLRAAGAAGIDTLGRSRVDVRYYS